MSFFKRTKSCTYIYMSAYLDFGVRRVRPPVSWPVYGYQTLLGTFRDKCWGIKRRGCDVQSSPTDDLDHEYHQEVNGKQWKSMKIHENQWKTMNINENWWKSMRIDKILLIFTECGWRSRGNAELYLRPRQRHFVPNTWHIMPPWYLMLLHRSESFGETERSRTLALEPWYVDM